MIVDEKIIKTISKLKLNISHYLILYCLGNNLNWYIQLKDDRMSNFKYLKRRGLITKEFQLTDKGKKLLEGQIEIPKKLKDITVDNKVENLEKQFAEFWNTFPSSDNWKHFPRTRTLRSNKMKAFRLYSNILDQKEYTHEQILNALKIDVQMKQKSSIVSNQLRYLQSICTWLNKRIFEGFIEDIEEQENNTKTDSNTRYGEEFE
jgi:hypothetical protein